MSFIETVDKTRIFYKDWGQGQPIVFSHGWPLCSDAWDGQMLFMLQNGFRVVAHDRRGHGRSDQPGNGNGNDMDTYADDLAAVMDALDLRGVIMVGHSTGGGEVARYIGRHGTARVAKAVLLGAVPPIMVSTPQWPGGLEIAVFDGIRKGVFDNRSAFYLDLAIPFFGMNREGVAVDEALRRSFWSQGMMGSVVGQYACIREFSEVDYTSDLEKIDVPTLVIHGDDDQIVPLAHAGALTAKVVRRATLKVYEGAPHGLAATHQDRLNADLLDFARS